MYLATDCDMGKRELVKNVKGMGEEIRNAAWIWENTEKGRFHWKYNTYLILVSAGKDRTKGTKRMGLRIYKPIDTKA